MRAISKEMGRREERIIMSVTKTDLEYLKGLIDSVLKHTPEKMEDYKKVRENINNIRKGIRHGLKLLDGSFLYAGSTVKISKISQIENPKVKSNSWEEYDIGSINNKDSLPIEYWVTGELVFDIEVGKPVRLLRKSQNGVKVGGIFTTSKITEIKGSEIHTENSIYQIELL